MSDKLSGVPVLARVVLAAGLVLAIFFGLAQNAPPEPVSADAPAEHFSSGRAMAILRVLAEKPHPLGSARHQALRDTLLNRLRSLGFEVELQPALITGPGHNPAIRISNIVARKKGTDSSKALLLMAHYDAVPGSYGASDDGAGVAAILETLRALNHGPALKNDLIVLFTDGEELGLVGARAFVQQHPFAAETGLVLNFEARGSHGASLLFETSENNGRLAREFSLAAPYPAGNSMAIEVYKRMPNDTDFSVFKQAGIPGLNFAYVDGHEHYHTPFDNLDTISEASLQHHGSYALSLTRHFGNLDLTMLPAPNQVYFTPLRFLLVVYSNGQALLLVLVAMFIFFAALRLGYEKELVSTQGLIIGTVGLLATVVVASVVFYAVQAGMSAGLPRARFYDLLSVEKYIFMGQAIVVFAIALAVFAVVLRKTNAWELTAGALALWGALTVLSAWFTPGASFFFLWPFFFSSLGFALIFLLKCEARNDWKPVLILLGTAVPVVVMLAPMIYMMLLGLTVRAAPVLTGLLALFSGLFVPHLRIVGGQQAARLAAFFAAVGALIVLGLQVHLVTTPPGLQRIDVLHITDQDSGESFWASYGRQVNPALDVFLGSNSQEKPQEVIAPTYQGVLRTAAAPQPSGQPEFSVIRDSISADVRYTTLRFFPGKTSGVLSLYVPADSSVRALHYEGRTIDLQQKDGAYSMRGWRWLVYYNVPLTGLDFVIERAVSRPAEVRMRYVIYGRPEGVAWPRPAMPRSDILSPRTIFRKSIHLEAE